MSFKIGDRVKIIDIDESYNTMYPQYLNATGTITGIRSMIGGAPYLYDLQMDDDALGKPWVEGFQIELVK